MNLDEIKQKYANLWVAAKVLKRDENGQPIDFEILEVSPDKVNVRNSVLNLDDICIFYVSELKREGYVWLL